MSNSANEDMDLTESIGPLTKPTMDVDNVNPAATTSGNLPPPIYHPAPPLQVAAYSVLRARQVVVGFLKRRSVEELVPRNNKIVVIDSAVTLEDAFRGLYLHGMRAAPVIDSDIFQFFGIISVTDVMESLINFHYTSPNHDIIMALKRYDVATWLAEKESRVTGTRLPLNPESTQNIAHTFLHSDVNGALFDACSQLNSHGIHRLPIMNKGAHVVCMLEHWRVLRFLHGHLSEQAKLNDPSLFDMSVGELGIGSFGHIVTCGREEQLVAVLERLRDHELSAVPIVDEDGRICDVYSRADITRLLGNNGGGLSLVMTVGECLRELRCELDRVETCRTSHTLRHVFERLDRTRKHRLYFVDDNGHVEGVVSLSDLLRYFMEGV